MMMMMMMVMVMMMMVCRKVIKGSDGNVILEITDTTGSHQFPAMRRLSVVRGGQWSAGHLTRNNTTHMLEMT